MNPPRLPLRFFRCFCHPELRDSIEGDLMELYAERLKEKGKRRADWKFTIDVLLLFRKGIIRPTEGYKNLNTYGMYKSYFKMGWRSLLRNRGYSYINIVGLTMGMAVTLLIGMWVYDEVSFNHYHKNYECIAQVYQHQTVNNEIKTNLAVPMPLANELKNTYRGDFKNVVQMWWEGNHVLSIDDTKIPRNGVFMSKEGLEMFSFEMKKGSWKSLDEPASVILSEATALALFGDGDPVNQTLKIDNRMDVKVTGVFKIPPTNSRFHKLEFISSWDLWMTANEWMRHSENNWNSDDINFSDILTFVEISPTATFKSVSDKIEKIKFNKLPQQIANEEQPRLFLYPMDRWHLYSEWKNGQEAGGRIQFVWLFGIIGFFVLLLACINFMNLSTAQSEMRAKEVGIRKTIGSQRAQLVSQFFIETFLLVAFAFVLAMAFAGISLPWFNQLAEKEMIMPWRDPSFIFVALFFVVITSLLAGSYPALFLSSFQPVKVLKGTFRLGKLAHLPRKILVVMQFTVSVALIIGTVVVWRQIQFAKERPIGYTREGLIAIRKTSDEFMGKSRPLRHKLRQSDAVLEVAESSSPATETWFTFNNLSWQGKDPNVKIGFNCSAVTADYGKMMEWNFIQGRDFSREISTDSSAVILNQSAARLIGWRNPIDEEISWQSKKFRVIGVIQDVIVDSPYEPVKPSVYFMTNHFFLNTFGNVWITLRLNPNLSTHEAISRVEKDFKSIIHTVPFEFKFIDQEYEKKFASEERIGKLATLFASLAIFISSLGLFGLASFVAQQRTKEIGIRKVMGASVLKLWKMLSKDFLWLVILSFCFSIPVSYYMMHQWLQYYSYHIEMDAWIFVITAMASLIITLATVSYQSIKAALANPVNSLRTE
jgi:ABC-type antimicrobial peptide transport system permease subunit